MSYLHIPYCILIHLLFNIKPIAAAFFSFSFCFRLRLPHFSFFHHSYTFTRLDSHAHVCFQQPCGRASHSVSSGNISCQPTWPANFIGSPPRLNTITHLGGATVDDFFLFFFSFFPSFLLCLASPSSRIYIYAYRKNTFS